MSSLTAISLIAAQVDFLEDMCLNRTGDESVFEELKDAIDECQSVMLNGTDFTLSFDALVNTEPKEFYDFYKS